MMAAHFEMFQVDKKRRLEFACRDDVVNFPGRTLREKKRSSSLAGFYIISAYTAYESTTI